jgi:transposase, IS5 family
MLIGNVLERIFTDAGYRGHNAPPEYKFRVFTAGQKRRVTPQIKRQMRRRAAVEPVIGHLKAEHRMGRNYLAHPAGDAINAVLAAAGYNFRLLIRWLSLLWLRSLSALATPHNFRPPENWKVHGRQNCLPNITGRNPAHSAVYEK